MWDQAWNHVLEGSRNPPWEGAVFGVVWPIQKDYKSLRTRQ